MRQAVELVGLVTAGVFTGGALFAALVEHPARSRAGTAVSLAVFEAGYRRAALAELVAAAVTVIACTAATALGGRALWLIAGLVIGAAIPVAVAVAPINRRLLEARAENEETPELLRRWARLHELRTALAVVGFVLVAVAALGL